ADRARHDAAEPLRDELVLARRLDRLERAEPPRELERDRLADVGNPEPDEQLLEPATLRCFDAREEVVGALLAHALELEQLLAPPEERRHAADRTHAPLRVELLDELRAHALDVQRAPRGEALDLGLPLLGALGVRAAEDRLALGLLDRRTAGRALPRD